MNRVSALSALLCRPLFVRQAELEVMIGIVSRGEHFSDEVRHAKVAALSTRNGDPLKNVHGAEVLDGMAVIPVNGALIRHAEMFDEISGATSYEQIAKEVGDAERNPKVHTIALRLTSPGGDAFGCSETADLIAKCQKPTVAYIEGLCCSAAYMLASACDEIVINESGAAGCLGTIMAIEKYDKALENAGIKRIEFISDQTPNKNADPESEAGRAQYQQMVNDMAEVFISRVARGRKVSAETVKKNYGQGATLVGQRAVGAGLADRIGNFDELLAEMVGRHQQETMMKFTMQTLKLADDASDEQVQARIADLAGFEKSAMAATGAENADEALGRIKANATAAVDLATIRTERAAEVKAATQKEFHAVLQAALSGDKPRLTLSEAARMIPTLLDEEEEKKAVAAYGAIKEQTAEAVVGALCAADASPRALTRVKAYVDAKAPVIPATQKEPAHDPEAAKLTDMDRKIKASVKETVEFFEKQKRK